MNLEILKISLKEFVQYQLIYALSTISAVVLFLILESFGFDNTLDSPTAIYYGLPPIFFNASLLGADIALLFFIMLRTDIENPRIVNWKLKRPNLGLFKYLCLGIGGAFAILVFDYVELITLSAFFDESDLYFSYWNETRNFGIGETLYLLFNLAILTPIVEELYFREVMLGSIHRSSFPNFAILFSCATFAIIHFDFVHIFAYLFSGLIFSLLYLKTRSILPSITAHILVNLFAFYTLHFL